MVRPWLLARLSGSGNEAKTTCSRLVESESSLPRATDEAEEGSKNCLRSNLRASNFEKFPWEACAVWPKVVTISRSGTERNGTVLKCGTTKSRNMEGGCTASA